MATTTPNYGWPVPTSTDYVKDGATAIEALGDAIDATVFANGTAGLKLVKKQTIGTGVSSVTVTGAFSATYEAYKIIITGGTSSVADRNLNIRFDGSTTGYYYCLLFGSYAGAAPANTPGNNVNGITYVGLADTNGLSADITVTNPFLAKYSSIIASLSGPTIAGTTTGLHQVATSYTGFVITPNTGTLTGGTISVYGYGLT